MLTSKAAELFVNEVVTRISHSHILIKLCDFLI